MISCYIKQRNKTLKLISCCSRNDVVIIVATEIFKSYYDCKPRIDSIVASLELFQVSNFLYYVTPMNHTKPFVDCNVRKND